MLKRAFLIALCFIFLSLPANAGQTDYEFFTAYDIASTSYVYTEGGLQANTSGAVEVGQYAEKTIHVLVTTLNSAYIVVRIETGIKYTANDTIDWSDYRELTYSKATSVSEYYRIQGTFHYLRIGLKCVGNVAGDSITILGSFSP